MSNRSTLKQIKLLPSQIEKRKLINQQVILLKEQVLQKRLEKESSCSSLSSLKSKEISASTLQRASQVEKKTHKYQNKCDFTCDKGEKDRLEELFNTHLSYLQFKCYKGIIKGFFIKKGGVSQKTILEFGLKDMNLVFFKHDPYLMYKKQEQMDRIMGSFPPQHTKKMSKKDLELYNEVVPRESKKQKEKEKDKLEEKKLEEYERKNDGIKNANIHKYLKSIGEEKKFSPMFTPTYDVGKYYFI